MNAFLETWANWIIERSLIAALACVLILMLAVLLKRRASAHAMSYLALLPLLLLLFPLERCLPRFDLGWSWPRMEVPRADFAATPVALPLPVANAVSHAEDAPLHSRSNRANVDPASPADVSAPTPQAPQVNVVLLTLFGAWFFIASLALLRFAYGAWIGTRNLARAGRVPEPSLRKQFDRLQARSGVRRAVHLRLITGLGSPALGNLWRPTIYAPPELMTSLETQQQRWVLLHELAHARRRDLWAALLEHIVLALWFFHPAAWIARALAHRWREFACDEAALAQLGTHARRASAKALLEFGALVPERNLVTGSLNSLIPSHSLLRTRIMRLLDSQTIPTAGISLPALLFLGLSTTAVLAATRLESSATITITSSAVDEVQQARADVAAWLIQRQEADGHWRISNDPAVQVQAEYNEARTTALAVRALLGELRSKPTAPTESAVQRGVEYLESSQDGEGCFGSRDHFSVMYAQAAVLRALCEFDAHAPDPARVARLQKSVDFIERARNPYRGWRYSVIPDGDNDSKITASMLVALAAAKARGVVVNPAAIECGLSVLEELTDPASGRTGFVSKGTPATRYQNKRDDFPSRYSEEPTAMQLLARYACGETPIKSKSMRQGLSLLTDCLPKWSLEDGSIDYAYWNEGAEVIARAGGYAAEAWRAALHTALVSHRISADSIGAYWPAIDAWSEKGMEVYASATALLALQALAN